MTREQKGDMQAMDEWGMAKRCIIIGFVVTIALVALSLLTRVA